MKKVLATSSVLLGVVFLAGCGQQPVSQTQPTTPAPVAQTPAVNQPPLTPKTQPTTQPIAPTDETANWQKYANDKYGIEFKYPIATALVDSSSLIKNDMPGIKNADKRLLLLSFTGNSNAFGEFSGSLYNASVTVYGNNSATTAGAKSQNTKNLFVEKELNTPNGKFILQDSYGTLDNYFLNAYFIGSNYTYDFQLDGDKYQKDAVDLFKKMLLSAKLTK